MSLNWLVSYLVARGPHILVPSQVPQDGRLQLLLFLLFINDLPNVIFSSDILMYADDVKFVQSFDKFFVHVNLQDDLNSFFLWCEYHLMELSLLVLIKNVRGVLGFINRLIKEFSDPYVRNQLLISLVTPILEYRSVVKYVQNSFDYFVCRYVSRLVLIKLPTLKSRRTMIKNMFYIKFYQ